MRQKLFSMAGALALLAVLGKYYAQPVLAQVRAALVSDIDNPARGFVQFSRFVGPPTNTSTHDWSQNLQYVVPGGKRLVIDNISVVSFALAANSVTTPFLLVIGNNAADCNPGGLGDAYTAAEIGNRAALAVPLIYNGLDTSAFPSSNSFGNSLRVQAYADTGQCLGGRFTSSTFMTFPTALSVTVSGHLVTP
jgi:hypothetical protein